MKYVYILTIILLTILNSFSQDDYVNGNLFIKNYSAKEFKSEGQNWSIAQAKDGIVYFGNNLGVLEFDGVVWSRIPLSNQSVVRTVTVFNDTIFVAGNNEFGYLKSDSLGATSYISISSMLPSEDRNFGDIWGIKRYNNKLYFIGKKDIVILEKGKLNKMSFDFEIAGTLSINDEFIVFSHNAFFNIKKGKLNKLYAFNNSELKRFYVLKLNNKEFVIVNDKPFKIDLSKVLGDNKNFKTDFYIENIDELIKDNIFNVDVSNNEDYIFSTINGAYVYNKDFKFQYLINKKAGLATDNVLNSMFDVYGNIWIVHGAGISYVEFNSPFSIYSEKQNVSNDNLTIIEFKNKIYLSSINEIKVLKKGADQFVNFDNVSYNNFASKIVIVGSDSVLFLTSSNRLYYTFGDELKLLKGFEANEEVLLSLEWTEKHENILFVGGVRSVQYLTLNIKNKELSASKVYNTGIKGLIISMASDNDGNIWAAPYYNKLCKIVIDSNLHSKEYYFGKEYGLELNLNRVFFNKNINKLIVLNKKVYTTEKEYDPNATNYKFINNSKYFKPLENSKNLNVYSEGGGKMIMYGASEMYSCKYNKERIVVDSLNYKKLQIFESSGGISYISKNGDEWLVFANRIVRTDTSKMNNIVLKPLPVMISRITINSDSIIYYGRDTSVFKYIDELDYKDNSLSFEYSLPYYVGQVKYKYILEGFNRVWSILSVETKAVYTNLDAGDYVFKVIGINVYGEESEFASFSFTILTPWYRSVLMYIVYLLSIVLIVIIVIYFYTKNLKESNKRLENTVKERTKEIRAKNVLITDSINYARHIQKAVLPTAESMANEFENSFVYFKPRDIVSGDFYWCAQKNNSHYIAVADCTGHGVPGAFMSMIGNTLLNQIINEQDVDTPSDVLGRLNNELKKVFSASESQDDGMDITVCKINRTDSTFEISMANHIAIILKDREIEEVNGDIYSIGGPFAKPDKLKFTNIKRNIEKGTTLYMFSDGYPDQFGGEKNEKFKMAKLKELLLKYNNLEMAEQRSVLKDNFEKWKGEYRQIDDVLIIGIKF